MPGVCQAGWSAAVSCVGLSWWQTRQLSSRPMGKWHSPQCTDGGDAQRPRWLMGGVSSWQRTQ
jgi:hypothetical protein